MYQDVDLSGPEPSINNVVDFGPSVGFLRVAAQASTDSRPLAGFTPRCGWCEWCGLVAETGADSRSLAGFTPR